MQEIRKFINSNPLLVGGLTIGVGVTLYLRRRKRSKTPPQVLCPADTVLLHMFTPGPHAPSVSPFPMKLEAYMRLANIPYMREFQNPMSPKTQKCPWITYNGEDVSDSQFIIEYLNKKLDVDLNHKLNKEERSVARAIQILVDEHLYWCLAYFRWVHGFGSSTIVKQLLPGWFLRQLAGREMRKQTHSQGISRHSCEEVAHILRTDLKMLQNYLGTKPFLMGTEPSEVDCSAFGMLVNLVYHYTEDIVQGILEREFPSLYQYVMRLKDRLYPNDWEQACKAEETAIVFRIP